MALSVSSILQYKHFQTLLGQEVLNVQYYVVLALATLADDLSDYTQGFFDQYSIAMRQAQSTGLAHVRGELYEVNGLDFGIYVPPAPVVGVDGTDPLPSFSAVKIQQVRASRATRHGWKRIAGLVEANVVGNSLTTQAREEWQGIADELWGQPVEFLSSEFPDMRYMIVQPIIWGGNDPDFPLGRYSAIETLSVSPNVTTQNSRKVGRGS